MCPLKPFVDVWVQSAGLGHVTRQIALAGELRRRLNLSPRSVRFLVDDNAAIQERVRQAGYPAALRPVGPEAASEFLRDLWHDCPPRLFILDTVDHYRHPAMKRVLAVPGTTSVVVIDDPVNRAVCADLVVNGMPMLHGAAAPVGESTRYLLGVDYFVVSPEFVEHRRRGERIAADCTRGFAFFGGADLEDFTGVFLDAIDGLGGIEWTLLIGPLYAHAEQVRAGHKARNLRVTVADQVPSMARTMAAADLTVIGAGNSLIEAAAVGTPAIVCCQNPVQLANASFFASTCGVANLGLRSDLSPARLRDAILELAASPDVRRAMSARLVATVDGRGANRVAEAICQRIEGQ
jgi:UDP-2,4-diacetamido-2,4,6-trideoxy-beta-L-altropyranose hydrolase